MSNFCTKGDDASSNSSKQVYKYNNAPPTNIIAGIVILIIFVVAFVFFV